jgi:anion transporter
MRNGLLTALAAIATAIYVMPPPAGMSSSMMHAGVVVFITMALLATGLLSEYVTALLFFLVATLLAIAPASVVFSGFASSTAWLVFGGLIVAEAVNSTGLGKRVAAMVIGRRTLSYPKLIALAVTFSTALAFVMPATLGRILLLLPVLGAVAEHAGLARGGKGHNGVYLAAIMSTYQCGTAVLPANAPNLVLAGASESLYHVQLNYAEYLLVQFPVMGFIKGVVIALLTYWTMKETTRPAQDDDVPALGPMQPEERRLAVILVAALVLWATDFAHGIPPGWVALAAGLACVLPMVGAVSTSALNEKIRLGSFFYVAAVLGLGAVLSQSGLAQQIGNALNGFLYLERGSDFLNFASLTLLSSVTGLLTTNPVQPALLAPLAGHFADATGWPIKAALMTIAVGFTTIILPYQVPPVVVGLQAAGLSLRATLRFTVPLAVISLLILVPLDYGWWRLIGYLRA